MTTEIRRCPDGCDNITPPYCHCVSCSATGIPLGPLGVCDDCQAADVVEDLEVRLR